MNDKTVLFAGLSFAMGLVVGMLFVVFLQVHGGISDKVAVAKIGGQMDIMQAICPQVFAIVAGAEQAKGTPVPPSGGDNK